MANPRVLFLNQDIFDLGYVESMEDVDEYKTFSQDKLIQNTYTLTVKNFDNYFSIGNPVSVLNNIDWRYSQILIYNEDNELIWDGIVEDIIRDHTNKTAQIISKNVLAQLMNYKIEYVSSAWENPIDSLLGILSYAGYTAYDNTSLQASRGLYDLNSCQIKVNMTLDDDITLQQAIEKLAEAVCADAYSHLNNLYFQHFTSFAGGCSISLQTHDLITAPIIHTATNEIINDYRIHYDGDGGTPATDSNSNNIGAISRSKYGTHSLSEFGADNAQIMYENKTSATYIGEAYINRTHYGIDTNSPRPLEIINFDLPIKHRDWVSLISYFKLTFSEEGWNEKIWEIFRFNRDLENQRMQIEAYEVSS